MKLIFERSVAGRGCSFLPEWNDSTGKTETGKAQATACAGATNYGFATREKPLNLPEVSENELSRHYSQLAKATHGVNDGFYPLGSCTMKYNPKVNEETAALKGFTGIHPLQQENTIQGCLEVLATAEKVFCQITGMDSMTFQPAAGAHGEFTGLLLIKAYHQSRGDEARKKIIVPDSAHGTNPASAVMAGFEVINIPSRDDGCVDLDELRKVVGPDTAGLMLTNPNTVGIFDKNITQITEIVHQVGGLCYYDGANLNAVMGIVRPGDMGFDVMHLNLHKTFATPHGGGGPGSGPVGCKEFLAEFLPGKKILAECSGQADEGLLGNACGSGFGYHRTDYARSIGQVKAFYGNFLVVVKALTYVLMLGKEGIPEACRNAVLNANYIRVKLAGAYHMAYDETCMHEFVMSLEQEKGDIDVSALDVAKALLDYGIHPPTMYFPLIVHEALMVEPTETESKETLDELISAFLQIHEKAKSDPEYIKASPHTTVISRPDEVEAARHPKVRYEFN